MQWMWINRTKTVVACILTKGIICRDLYETV